MNFDATPEYAIRMDEADLLASFRDLFAIPRMNDGRPMIYFCGNSLGLMPLSAKEAINADMKRWENRGIAGYWEGKEAWLNYPDRLAELMAPVVGCMPDEVVIMNGLTINLHLMMISFYRPSGRRRKILIEANAFPSDQYAVASQLALHGYDPQETLVRLPLRQGEVIHRHQDICDFIEANGDEIALVMLSGINYYSGQAFAMEKITALAQKKGCRVGWDLAHVAGNLPLQLHDWQVDFACWCTYKYLNSGPGSLAGCFVHQRHHQKNDLPRLSGWWGNSRDSRFLMLPEFEAASGAQGWQVSCMPVTSMAPMVAALAIFAETDMASVRKKSIALTSYLEYLILRNMSGHIDIITPSNPEERGCQLSLVLRKEGRAIFQQLSDAGIVCDWREPNVIRVAPVPLYNTFREVWQFSEILTPLVNK